MRLFGAVVMMATLAAGQTLLPTFDRPEIIHFDDRPMWNGPFLTTVEKNDTSSPFIWTLDRYGNKEEIPFPVRGAARVYIHDLTASADGTLIVVGDARDEHGFLFGVMATIPKGRHSSGILRDEAFSPRHVAVTSDGVIWVIGTQYKPTYYSDVLRRFSPSGKLLTSQIVTQEGRGLMLRAAGDRVGWLLDKAYIEFALDGSIMNHFPAPPGGRYASGFVLAIRPDLQTVAQTRARQDAYWSLDRATRTWNKFDADGRLMGFDGDQLVLAHDTPDRGLVLAHYFLTPDEP